MKIIESDEKRFCDNCYTYGYTGCGGIGRRTGF